MSNREHIILVVHGMGTHPEGATRQRFIEGFNEGLGFFGIEDWNLEKVAEIREFNYSEFIDDQQKNDAEYAKSLANVKTMLKGRGFTEKFAKSMIDEFGKFEDKDQFFYSSWLDVIYYSLLLQGVYIRVQLAKTIAQTLKDANVNQKVHIVAHSLGTAVVHDTLAQLFVKDSLASYDHRITKIDTARTKIDSVWMVANVSRLVNLLNGIADPNHSIVHSDSGGCTKYFFNVAHELDPFTWFKEYKRSIMRSRGSHINTSVIHQVNTHDLKEYVRDPLFIQPFMFLLKGVVLTRENLVEARKLHKQNSVQDDLHEIKAQAQVIKDVGGVIDGVQSVYTAVKSSHEFYERVRGMIEKELDL
ncbi:hypothetical protein C9J01_18815 [Photobacterium rosenbergii]|uniref:Alpha/beta hydrolase n=1 Tax=Photobacterium rosenbergii TaxID=294936 RepID=A0A2T3N9T7_9GAMM|nr:alpha/beta hydrolase [Photobacterium rosenbergii]PSW10265.1 hypothetical protein C9J01_18815 [Photobacterium rosenbergii]